MSIYISLRRLPFLIWDLYANAWSILPSLAILGEASIKVNVQVATLSWSTLLLRLLAAPQALIRTSRPVTLKPHAGKVIGVHNGGVRYSITHIAHLVLGREHLPPYTVRCERISKTKATPVGTARLGPLVWLDAFNTATSASFFALAVARSDGFAILATILLSLLSSVVGLGNRWSLKLGTRRATREVPPNTVVLEYLNGSFIIVRCDENIARELYWHAEACHYLLGDRMYRAVSLIGTLLLMSGVICLGNSTFSLQFAFAAAYIVLNAAYWAVAALPQHWHWDLSRYRIDREIYQGKETQDNFTLVLWRAIAITESADWVKREKLTPASKSWDRWIDDAQAEVWAWKTQERERGSEAERTEARSLPKWDAEQALTKYLDSKETASPEV